MYLYVGKELVLNEQEIMAIFHMDTVKNTKEYKKFYQKLLEENCVQDVSGGKAKSLILTQNGEHTKAYVSNVNVSTIEKRFF